jgi:hypothetical protein
LIVYVRFVDECNMREELFFCEPILKTKWLWAVVNMINAFFNKNGISWDKCTGICTDGARSMSGVTSYMIIARTYNYLSHIETYLSRQLGSLTVCWKLWESVEDGREESIYVINSWKYCFWWVDSLCILFIWWRMMKTNSSLLGFAFQGGQWEASEMTRWRGQVCSMVQFYFLRDSARAKLQPSSSSTSN